jgi:hypothetical protein
MHPKIRHAALAALLAVLAACHYSTPSDAPLAFVPDDTPYVYANLEPVPAALTEAWSRPLQDYWPTLFGMYETMLRDPKLGLGDRTRRIATVLIDELKTHANWDRLREIGLKPDARVAVYGFGFVPVLRLELGDPAAFSAEVARVEQSAGAKLTVAKAGTQEYWQLGADTIALAIAIEGSHLVITALPPNGSDALKQTLLGVVRPQRSLAESGALEALAKQYGYSNYGTGYVDFVRLVERLGKPLAGSDADFAKALGLPAIAADAVCQREYVDIARKFPRLVIGAEEMSAQRIRIASQFEIEPGLAGRFANAIGAAPGTGADAAGAFDLSLALPILKLKDFWVAEAASLAAKPYACAKLQGLNEALAESRAKVDVTIPPPVSDLTGLRASVSKVDFGAGNAMPDVAAKLLVGTTNPLGAFGMAQLTLPQLQKLKITQDGKPVALPPDLLPVKTPPVFVAMSDKAIAFAAGDREAASLPAFLSAPAAAQPVFLRMHFSGAVYGWMAHGFGAMKDKLPAPNQATLDQQIKLFGLYEKWLRSNDITLTATPGGIQMRQTVQINPQ